MKSSATSSARKLPVPPARDLATSTGAAASSAEAEPVRRGRGRPRIDASVSEVTLQLIGEVGAENVTMELIAERAGISKITLYRNWKNRASLLSGALLAEIERTLPLDPDGPPAETIERHAIKFAKAMDGPLGELMRQIVGESLSRPELMIEFRDHYLGLRRPIGTGLIKRGIADGSFIAKGRPVVLHDAFWGALFYRTLFAFKGLGAADVRELIDTILQPAQARAQTPRAAS